MKFRDENYAFGWELNLYDKTVDWIKEVIKTSPTAVNIIALTALFALTFTLYIQSKETEGTAVLNVLEQLAMAYF